MKVSTKIEYTEENALITQDGFFGSHTCRIKIPLDKVDLVAETLSDMYFKWLSQINKISEQEHLYYELEISDNQKIEIEEGIGNWRDRDNDQFAVYHIYGEKMINDFYHNTVVFKMSLALILSGLLKNKEEFTWEYEQ
jgi:hypothetical protein